MSDPSLVRAVLVLPVADMRQARTWYAGVLDFEVVYFCMTIPLRVRKGTTRSCDEMARRCI